ncbi:MAG: DUF2442 domain-containing protein [Planctomycetia bacterium]|nr:DUF2442 domain-containing protein [Planctomycetia bacterium]
MIRIIEVAPIHDFVVQLRFTDGSAKEVDLERFLHGPIFEPLRTDRNEFLKIHVDPKAGTIAWPNGADIDPDVLFYGLQPAWSDDAALSHADSRHT